MSEENLIISNDLYLVSYLLAEGCELKQCGRNSRRRISFVVQGERVQELREQYRTGIVKLNIRKYRDSIQTVRNLMDSIHRSNKECPALSIDLQIDL